MSRFALFALLVLLCLPVTTYGVEVGSVIKICGSGDNQELLRQLARAYESSHPGVGVKVPDSIGSSGGVKATVQGHCDIGRLARPLRAKEMRHKLSYKLFGRSPVVFMVSANQKSITNITAQQVVSVFSGKIRLWQELEGTPGTIYIANREKGDSSRTVLGKYLIDFALIKRPVGKTIYSTPETINIVGSHDDTIAYGPLSSTINSPGIHVLAFEGVMPSVAAMASGRYPLFSDFGLVWRADISPQAMAFISFLDTEVAREIIDRYGAAPVALENK